MGCGCLYSFINGYIALVVMLLMYTMNSIELILYYRPKMTHFSISHEPVRMCVRICCIGRGLLANVAVGMTQGTTPLNTHCLESLLMSEWFPIWRRSVVTLFVITFRFQKLLQELFIAEFHNNLLNCYYILINTGNECLQICIRRILTI